MLYLIPSCWNNLKLFMESLHNERWIDFEGENLFQFHFLFFQLRRSTSSTRWCYYRSIGSKQSIWLFLIFCLIILFLLTCIPAWATVMLRLQNVFCFKTWFHVMILWLISSWVVIFYFWFLSKEESCQYGLKQLNYFWVKTMYSKTLSQNIKVLLVFNRCYWERLMSYHSVSVIPV